MMEVLAKARRMHRTGGVHRPHIRSAAVLSVLAVLLALLIPVDTAVAKPPEIEEILLGSSDFLPGAITEGSDGNLWLTNRSGISGKPAYEQQPVDGIDRITPGGEVTEFPLPVQRGYQLEAIAAGPDGNVWFTDGVGYVGLISPSGQIAEFSLSNSPFGIVSGPGGKLWIAEHRKGPSVGAIGAMTPGGEIAEFALPTESYPGAITAGSDGNVWFAEQGQGRSAIGRITPQGQVTDFRLPHGPGRRIAITAGPDGNVWFTEVLGAESSVIGRVTPGGRIKEFPLPEEKRWPGEIATGPDGRLWFAYGPRLIGRITPSGRLTRIDLPRGEPVGLTAGQDDRIWYTAENEGACEGGGGSCQIRIPTPGIVGRITPAPLAIAIPRQSAKAKGRWMKVRLSCEEGDATDVCRGTLRLTARVRRAHASGRRWRTMTLARRRYRLDTDSTRAFSLRLNHNALDMLAPRRRLRARLTARLRGGRPANRSIALTGGALHRRLQRRYVP